MISGAILKNVGYRFGLADRDRDSELLRSPREKQKRGAAKTAPEIVLAPYCWARPFNGAAEMIWPVP